MKKKKTNIITIYIHHTSKNKIIRYIQTQTKVKIQKNTCQIIILSHLRIEIDIKGVKSDEKEYFFQNKKNKEIIEQKNKEIKELKEQISSTNNNNSDINKNFKKESDILIKRIEDLTNENNKLNKHINFLNSKNANRK